MSNVYEFEAPTQAYDEASDWIASLDRGLSPEEERLFREWMASPGNAAVLLEMAALWDDMEVLSRLSEICPHPVAREPGSRRFFIAASLLVVFVAGFWTAVKHRSEPPAAAPAPVATVYETAIGEQSTINLVDGTELVLNTNTLVQVKYTDEHRLVALERGEIHVSVASDPDRPLSVFAGRRIIQALGTAFNVEITGDQQVELVVTEGVVRVGVLQARPAHPVLLPPTSVSVAAGEETVLGQAPDDLAPIETDDIAVKLSWREGNLIFRGESLEEAVAEIGRYTKVEFVILDDASRHVRVAGMFKAGDVNGLLAVLEKNFNVTHRRVGANRIELQGR